LQLFDRREPQISSRIKCEENRGEASGPVRVGHLIDRPGWFGAECSCGETVEARVHELASAWAVYHEATVCSPVAVQRYDIAS